MSPQDAPGARTLSVRQRSLSRMGKGAMTYSGEGHEAVQVGYSLRTAPGTRTGSSPTTATSVSR